MALSTGILEARIARGAAPVTLVDVGVPTSYIDRLITTEKPRYAIASAGSGEAICPFGKIGVKSAGCTLCNLVGITSSNRHWESPCNLIGSTSSDGRSPS